MSLAQQAVLDLEAAGERFNRSTSQLTEALSGFAPSEGTMTAAQQVAHVARVIDWFIEGAFRPEGFDMNFEDQIRQVLAVDSLSAARLWFERSLGRAIEIIRAETDEELMMAIAEGSVLGGMPRIRIVTEMVEHTAHHRGALTIYARLNGVVPGDPYGM